MMLVHVAFFILWLTTNSFSTPLRKSRYHTNHKLQTRSSSPLPDFDKRVALAAQAATRRKFQNAPEILAGLGTSPGYAIPSSLQIAYNRASDFATNLTLLSSLLKSSPRKTFYSSSGVRVAAVAPPANENTIIDPLEDETDGVDDYEYYGPMSFGSKAQSLMIDFDTGSADLWVTVDCKDCGTLSPFHADASNTYRNTSQRFSVSYGSGSVSGTVAQDTVSLGPLKVYNQSIGAVQSVSMNFANSPNDGLAGLAFSTIAHLHKPTFFENLIPRLSAPLFSVYMTRNKISGSEIYLGGIDVSKASEKDISWVPVVSRTYWTVGMTAASVNDTLVDTGSVNAIVDTGTSFIYVPTHVMTTIYKLIPGSMPAPDYGSGFYAYPCNTTVRVSFKLGPHMLALDPRDFNLGLYASDATGSKCVAAIVDAGPMFKFAILGDSFIKSYVTIFDYAHGARVGFLRSLNE